MTITNKQMGKTHLMKSGPRKETRLMGPMTSMKDERYMFASIRKL